MMGPDGSAQPGGTGLTQTDSAPGAPTFVFTDVEGSTRLWERHPSAMKSALERHDALLQAAVAAFGGRVVKTTGDGFMCVFASAVDAVGACLEVQRRLAAETWAETGPLLVRMGIHTGHADERAGDYFGPTVIRTARIMAAGHGGQVLLSATAAALVGGRLPDGATLRDLGDHRLKDLERSEHLFQVFGSGLVSDFPPLATLDRRPNNLPTQPSTLIGREAEAEEIRKRLENQAVRLVTLTGPGGTGKTRLALRAAAESIDRFRDGVFFVDLSSMHDVEAVLAGVARAVGIAETSDVPLLDAVRQHLGSRSLLLVLDNFEQVTVAAPTVVQLLHDCPDLKLLVTSREPLRVRGEHVFPVPTLSLPATGGMTAAQLGRFEAIQLFVERAQAVRPDFRLTDANAEAVAGICRRLDGLPLAIELATARLNLFAPEALLDRLDKSLEFLRTGARDLPERQQTLRATIDWSYQLLEPAEQRLFELVSVFAAGRVEAIEGVANRLDGVSDGGDRLGGDGTLVVDALASLIDKSLIRQVDTGEAQPRLQMLETIREFASARLDARPGFAAASRRAHAAFYADLAQDRWEGLTGPSPDVSLDEMAADADDMGPAWRYWVRERDLERIDQLVDSLWLLYDARGWLHATIELATDLLEVLASTPDTGERAEQQIALQLSLARVLQAAKGFTDEVQDAYGRALELIRRHGSVPRLYPALRGLATFHMYRAEMVKAGSYAREILDLAEQQDDPGMTVEGRLLLGATIGFWDDPLAGLEHLERAIADPGPVRQRRFRFGTSPLVACHTTSAFLHWLIGHPERALDRATGALELARRLDHPFTIAYARFHSGVLHMWRREPEVLRDRGMGVLAIAREHDFQIWIALGTCLVGSATTAMGRTEEGLARIHEGLELYRGLRTPPVFWSMLLQLEAGALASAGQATAGLARVDEAMGYIGEGETVVVPEFQVLRGDLLMAIPDRDVAAAETSFQVAHDIAERLGLGMSRLRAATRLCRLWTDAGAPDRGQRVLRPVFDAFSEGFGTLDLIEAKEALRSAGAHDLA